MATAILHFPTPLARTALEPAPLDGRTAADDLLHDVFVGLQPGTVRTYHQQLGAFARWLGCSVEELPTTLLSAGRGPATQRIRRYRGALLERGLAPATVNGALAAIRSLVRTARAVGRIDWTVDIPSVRAEAYRDTRGPGVPAVQKLLTAAAVHRSPRMVSRNVAIVRTLFDLALRCNELTTLQLEHVEHDANGTPVAVHVLAKGHRVRQRLTLTPAASSAIAHWLDARGPAPGSLFGLGNRGIAKLLDRLGTAARVGHIRPHGIRHTSITAALEATNGDLYRVRAFSRHVKMDTVLKYNDARSNIAGAVAAVVSDMVDDRSREDL